jgi:hypothetical protein
MQVWPHIFLLFFGSITLDSEYGKYTVKHFYIDYV